MSRFSAEDNRNWEMAGCGDAVVGDPVMEEQNYS